MSQNSMSNNADGCGCNDYSLLTANTGIAAISTANPLLTGSGATAVVTSGGTNGTTIKSVIIKATAPVTTGMVRLFIGTGNKSAMTLYKEVPIPTTPALTNTPTPLPMLKTFEIMLDGNFKLQNGYKLYASTQNAEPFNIIAEALDWTYPGDLPSTCCNFIQTAAVTGLNTADTANPNLDGSGAIVSVFTAPSLTTDKGSIVKTITIKALQSTNEGIIRLFIGPTTNAFALMKEICIPETVQSGFDPSFKVVLDENYHLAPGYILGASTQIGQSFAITVEGIKWTYPI
jgi:hypothetical protein